MDRVRIAIIDANNAVQLAFLDNGARDSLHYYDDTLHTYLQGSAYTFECKVEKDNPDAQYLQAGNKLSFVFNQMPYNLTIMQTHEEEKFIEIMAYGCCFELLNETAPAYTASAAMTFVQYLSVFLSETDFVVVGINELGTKALKLEWTGTEDSLLNRIYSLATNFDAEVEIIPTLNADYTLGAIVLNIYQKHSDTQQGIGENRSDVVLRYGVNIEGVSRDVDATELYTAIKPTGKDGLTLTTYAEQTVYDDDGNILYHKPANSAIIYAPQARNRYPSNVVSSSDRYILMQWSTEYSTQAALYGNALAILKDRCTPKATYEVKGYTELNIGDTVTIVDNGFEPELYLSARVVEQQISFTDKTRNETKFDNITEMVSRISPTLLERVRELTAQVEQTIVDATIQYYVSTSPTSLVGGSWSTTTPTWTDGAYIWTRTMYTANDGSVTYSNPACATGAAGADGSALYAVCDTGATTRNKAVTIDGVSAYYVGLTVNITFTNGQLHGKPRININSLGNVNIYSAGELSTSDTFVLFCEEGTTLSFVYDEISAGVYAFRLINDTPGSYFGECSTAAATEIKEVDAHIPVVLRGTRLTVRFINSYSNSNGCILKPGIFSTLFFDADGTTRVTSWDAGAVLTAVFDVVDIGGVYTTAWRRVAEDGQDAITVSLSNDNHTFAGGTSAALAGNTTCAVTAYKGTTQVAATIGTITGQPTGLTTSVSNNGTTSASFTVTVDTTMTTQAGVLSVPVTVEGQTFNKTFSYSIALQGTQGQTGQTGPTGPEGPTGPAGPSGKMLYGTCSTTASTAAKEVVCSDVTSLYAGLAIMVGFSTANSATGEISLNVNNTGAVAVYAEGAITGSSNYFLWAANTKILFIYDGTGWCATGYGKSFWGTSSTAAATRAKASTIPGFVCAKGTRVSVRFTNANTYTAGTVRLNVSSTGAMDIHLNSTAVAGDSPYLWGAGETQAFICAGARWEIDSTAILSKALA